MDGRWLGLFAWDCRYIGTVMLWMWQMWWMWWMWSRVGRRDGSNWWRMAWFVLFDLLVSAGTEARPHCASAHGLVVCSGWLLSLWWWCAKLVVYFWRGEPKRVSTAWVERRRISGIASSEQQYEYCMAVHVLYSMTYRTGQGRAQASVGTWRFVDACSAGKLQTVWGQ
jgi:hypothetical protein